MDGYTSATATSYSGTNSPVILTWNCRDLNNILVPDGTYKFWVQYAENSGAGPYTTNGLLWAKGPAGATNNYANLAPNFTSMQAAWVPSTPPPVAPTITSAPPTANGTVGVPYNYTCTATGTPLPGFAATGLPTGLTINSTGFVSGTPTVSGTFNGTITATNGTLPNATQPFGIVISVVPASFTSVQVDGTLLVMSGSGPANGTYAVVVSTNANAQAAQWTPIATSTIGSDGRFSYTNVLDLSAARRFYRLRVP